MKRLKPGSPSHTSIKEKALRSLQQKKKLEAQRGQLQRQAYTIDDTIFTTQSMQDTLVQVNALQSAKQSMQTQMGSFDIADMDDLQDELEDLFDSHNQMQEALSRSYNTPEYDEADLDAELDALSLDTYNESDLLDGGDTVYDDTPSYLLPKQSYDVSSLQAPPSKAPVRKYTVPAQYDK